jgi:predicted Ser/Thr protein kinase
MTYGPPRELVERLLNQYIDEVFAYVNSIGVRDSFTGMSRPINHRMMEEFERYARITDQARDGFRRSVAVMACSNPGSLKTQLAPTAIAKIRSDTHDVIRAERLRHIERDKVRWQKEGF